MVIERYDVFLVVLDPTVGHEIKKTRPCLVLSATHTNSILSTIIIAPMTTKSQPHPSRIETFFGGKTARIILEQIRSIDKSRLVKRIGSIELSDIQKVKSALHEMLVA